MAEIMRLVRLCSSRGGRQTEVWQASGLLGHRRHHVHSVSRRLFRTRQRDFFYSLHFIWSTCATLAIRPGWNIRLSRTKRALRTRIMDVLMMTGLPGCRVTPPSTTKATKKIMTTTIRTCSGKSSQAITSLTLRTGTKSRIQVPAFVFSSEF